MIIIVLVLLYSKRKRHNILLPKLIEIRRNLALENVDYDNALRQADIVLTGMRLSDVFQDDVKAMIEGLENIHEALSNCEKELRVLKNINTETSSQISEEQKDIVDTSIKAAHQYAAKAESIVDEITTTSNKMRSGIKFIQKVAPELGGELENIYIKVGDHIIAIKEKINNIKKLNVDV